MGKREAAAAEEAKHGVELGRDAGGEGLSYQSLRLPMRFSKQYRDAAERVLGGGMGGSVMQSHDHD